MDFLRNKGAKFLQFIAIWAKRNFHALIFKVATVARLCLLTHHSKSPFTYLSKTKVTISIQNYKMPLARFARIFNFVLQFILGVRWKLEPRKRLDRKTKMMTDLVPQKKRDEQTVGNQHFFFSGSIKHHHTFQHRRADLPSIFSFYYARHTKGRNFTRKWEEQ